MEKTEKFMKIKVYVGGGGNTLQTAWPVVQKKHPPICSSDLP